MVRESSDKGRVKFKNKRRKSSISQKNNSAATNVSDITMISLVTEKSKKRKKRISHREINETLPLREGTTGTDMVVFKGNQSEGVADKTDSTSHRWVINTDRRRPLITFENGSTDAFFWDPLPDHIFQQLPAVVLKENVSTTHELRSLVSRFWSKIKDTEIILDGTPYFPCKPINTANQKEDSDNHFVDVWWAIQRRQDYYKDFSSVNFFLSGNL